ncbi:MAG TPA: hypothetical protein VHD87_14120 [Acidimicrobiales bacterium]|nr:hypothetical protein [Acidimicrobiales bacterium]
MTPSGSIRFFAVPAPTGLAVGPDGNIWFSEAGGKIGRIDLSQL